MELAASQAAFAEALIDPSRAMPRGLTTFRGTPDGARFAVYRNNVHVGLTAALAKRFPVVRKLVGENFFAGMARVYAGQEKPASPLLFEYGDGFADFIDEFEPARGLAYLGDVARVEAAWTRCYHAEDAEPLAAAQLAALSPDDLHQARLAVHPASSLICSPYPAGSIWASHQGGTVTPVAERRAEAVLVARPAMDVRVHVLPAAGAAFAQALFAGETLANAASHASAQRNDFDFGTALVGLVSLGAFRTIAKEEHAA